MTGDRNRDWGLGAGNWRLGDTNPKKPKAKSQKPKANPQSGFTLMEMLVTLAIFATVTVAVTDIFLLSSRAERRVSVEEKLSSEERTALEYIGRLIRTGSIVYNPLPNQQNPLTTLTVRAQNGKVYSFYQTGSQLVVREDAAEAPLTSAEVAVQSLKFYLSPLRDPFALNQQGQYDSNSQPRVTVALSLALSGKPENSVTVQTTFSTRQYER